MVTMLILTTGQNLTSHVPWPNLALKKHGIPGLGLTNPAHRMVSLKPSKYAKSLLKKMTIITFVSIVSYVVSFMKPS